MTDPRQRALEAVSRLLKRAESSKLTAAQCLELTEQVAFVPGWAKRVAHALSAQTSGPAVDALLTLPSQVPGIIEGVHRALAHGVVRIRRDGTPTTAMLAMDFRRSRARAFNELVARSRALFAEAFEALSVDGAAHFRFSLWADRGTLAGRASAVAHDIQWLHARLSRLRGTRLWINGWRFDGDGTIGGPAQVHLVRAWLSWAAGQTETRR